MFSKREFLNSFVSFFSTKDIARESIVVVAKKALSLCLDEVGRCFVCL